MADLDEREEQVDAMLRASGPNLRAAISHVAVSEFRKPRSLQRRSWVIAIAAVVVLILGLVAIGTNRNDRSIGNDPKRLHWLVSDPPADMSLLAMGDPQSQSGSTDAKTMTSVYATDAAPLGAILSVRGSMGSVDLDIVPASEGGTNFEETTIDGRRAAFANGQPGQRLVYIETGGRWVGMTSRNIDDTTLQRVAQAAVRNADGTAAIPAASLPAGLRLVLRADAPLEEMLGGSEYSQVSYGTPTGTSLDLRVTVPALATRAVAGLGVALTPTKIGDFDGFSGKSTSTDVSFGQPREVRLLIWQREGLAFQLRGVEVTDGDMSSAARSVKPTSEANWNKLLQQTGYDFGSAAVPAGTVLADTVPADTVPAIQAPAGTDPPFIGSVRDVTVNVAVTNPSPNDQTWTGTLPTGEKWQVDLTRVFDSMALRPTVDGQGGGMSYGPVTQTIGCCAPLYVITADPSAIAFRVTTNHGDRFIVPLHDFPGTDGLRIALVALADGGGPQLAELIDTDGNVLESMPASS